MGGRKKHNREEWKKLLRMAGNVQFCMCQWNERISIGKIQCSTSW
jgi:predicted SprT family Zn-dependent metalloprotease